MEQKALLPITDVIAEMQKQLPVCLEKPNLSLPEHVRAGSRLNQETAAVGQVSISSDTPSPDPAEVEKSWINGEYGYFRFVINKKSRIIGGVWSLEDTHVVDANRVLHEAGTGITLSSDPTRHREASSFIFEGTPNEDQADIDASTMQLAEEFGLIGNSTNSLDTISVYMDEIDEDDRRMMRSLGFISSADGVSYEGVEELCTVFVATRESVRQAIYDRAQLMGINITPQNPAAMK